MEWDTSLGEAYLEIGKSKFSFFIRLRSGSKTLLDGHAEVIDGTLPELIEKALFPVGSETATVSQIWFSFGLETPLAGGAEVIGGFPARAG